MNRLARAFRWIVAIRWRYCLITAIAYVTISGSVDVAKHRFWWPGTLLAAVGWYLLVYLLMWLVDVCDPQRRRDIVREREARRG